MNKKTVGWLLGLALCAGAGAWYLTARGAAPAAGKGAPPPVTVNVVQARRQDVPVQLQGNGSVTPLSSVDLHPQTTSTIAKVHIREGQFVKAGELLFTLDARSEQANTDKAQAQLARDQAASSDLERQYRRGMELLGRNFIAQGAVDTLKSQLESARALVTADLAAVRAAQVDAGYTSIRAPMAGRVGAIPVYPGTLVQLATSLTTVTQLDPINVSFTLPESSLTALLAAQQAGAVAVTATVGEAGKRVEGKLSFIDNTVDPSTGVIRVKAEFGNGATQLWPGQYVHVGLTLQTLKEALVIPQNAIIDNSGATFVYTMEPDHSAKMRPVKRLYAFGPNVAVSGLAGDEQVIVDGKQNLRPGAPVRLAEAAKPARAQTKGKPE